MSNWNNQTKNSEALLVKTLMNKDLPMNELMGQWSIESNQHLFGAEAQATTGANTLDDDWSAPESPQATAGAQDPEIPSLTAGAWAPKRISLATSQYVSNPSLFGGINIPIDPALLAISSCSPPQIMEVESHPSSSAPVTASAFSLNPAITLSAITLSKSRKSKTSGTAGPTRIVKSPRRPKYIRKGPPPGPTLAAPLSVLTASSSIPLKDILAHIQRPTSVRQAEASAARYASKQKIPRPLNSFLLYRSAYTERIKGMEKGKADHQVLSKIAGESWRMETEDVRRLFEEYGRIEKEEHARAWPGYVFAPGQAI